MKDASQLEKCQKTGDSFKLVNQNWKIRVEDEI